MMDAKSGVRNIPLSELDLQLILTDPMWGQDVSPELREKLEDVKLFRGKDGRLYVEKDSLWGLLGYYTRDLRLGNLSSITGELQYCQEMLDFAGDCLRLGLIQSFMTALSYVITVLELSQSKGGFLRRRQGTITQEKHETTRTEPPKKSVFMKFRRGE